MVNKGSCPWLLIKHKPEIGRERERDKGQFHWSPFQSAAHANIDQNVRLSKEGISIWKGAFFFLSSAAAQHSPFGINAQARNVKKCSKCSVKGNNYIIIGIINNAIQCNEMIGKRERERGKKGGRQCNENIKLLIAIQESDKKKCGKWKGEATLPLEHGKRKAR